MVQRKNTTTVQIWIIGQWLKLTLTLCQKCSQFIAAYFQLVSTSFYHMNYNTSRGFSHSPLTRSVTFLHTRLTMVYWFCFVLSYTDTNVPHSLKHLFAHSSFAEKLHKVNTHPFFFNACSLLGPVSEMNIPLLSLWPGFANCVTQTLSAAVCISIFHFIMTSTRTGFLFEGL